MDRKSRLEDAKRRHRQARDLPKLRQLIAAKTALAHELAVHDLNESITLEGRLYEKLRELRARSELRVTAGLEGGEFEHKALVMLEADKDTTLLVYFCRWSGVGAIVLTGEQLARNARALLELDGDTVTACTPSLHFIVSFDLSIDYGVHKYEIDEWRQPDTTVGLIED